MMGSERGRGGLGKARLPRHAAVALRRPAGANLVSPPSRWQPRQTEQPVDAAQDLIPRLPAGSSPIARQQPLSHLEAPCSATLSLTTLEPRRGPPEATLCLASQEAPAQLATIGSTPQNPPVPMW